MPFFRKKPVVIEAWEVRLEDANEPPWVVAALADERLYWCPSGDGLMVQTLEGWLLAREGDMLIKGVKGELYPCKPDIFAATYEPAG